MYNVRIKIYQIKFASTYYKKFYDNLLIDLEKT